MNTNDQLKDPDFLTHKSLFDALMYFCEKPYPFVGPFVHAGFGPSGLFVICCLTAGRIETYDLDELVSFKFDRGPSNITTF